MRQASCRHISHRHKHMLAWLTSRSQSGLIWLCVNVCLFRAAQRFSFLSLLIVFHMKQKVNLVFLTTKVTVVGEDIYEVALEHRKFTLAASSSVRTSSQTFFNISSSAEKLVAKAKPDFFFFLPMIAIENSTGTQRTNQQPVRLPPSRTSGFYRTFP